MQDKEIIERVREDFISLVRLPFEAPSSTAKVVDKILSHPNICVFNPDAELPEIPMSFRDYEGYERCKEDMLKAGWVKGVKDE